MVLPEQDYMKNSHLMVFKCSFKTTLGGESFALKLDIYRRLADFFRFYLHLLPLRGAFGTQEQRQRPRCQTLLLPEDEMKEPTH